MDEIVGLIGREALVADLVAEIRKGKHVILSGPVGIGKSAVLKAALEKGTVVFRVYFVRKLFKKRVKFL